MLRQIQWVVGAVGVTWGDPDFMSVHLPSVLLVTFSG